MDTKFSKQTRHELLEALRDRYRNASKIEKLRSWTSSSTSLAVTASMRSDSSRESIPSCPTHLYSAGRSIRRQFVKHSSCCRLLSVQSGPPAIRPDGLSEFPMLPKLAPHGKMGALH